jgi:hypothetical protein
LDGATLTTTELNYVDGVTSSIQTQLDAKQATITGGATSIVSSNLTGNRALASDVFGKVVVTSVTDTELGYISGLSSNVQTQLNNKQGTITGGASTITTSDLTVNRALVSNASGKVVVSGVSSTELGYLIGVTSDIQTQLDAKQATISSSNRLNANLIGDGSVDNTEFAYLDGITSSVQTQLDNKATKGFAIAMAIAL